MAYIAPNSTVILLKNIPLEPNFENTVWYNNETEQEQDFLQQRYSPRTFTSQSYVHKDRGVIRLEVPLSQVYDCNYMMFKNTSFENKWFYAFVTRVEYVSNEVTEVYFTIDPIQTWLKRFTVDDSFIAREHTYTDKSSDWLIPESVDAGAYVLYDEARLFSTANMYYVIAAPFSISYVSGGSVTIANYGSVSWAGGMPSGIYYTLVDNIIDLAHILYELANTVQSPSGSTGNAISEVIAVFQAPYDVFNATTLAYEATVSTAVPVQRTTIPATASLNAATGSSYTIKNHKLNAYPFRYILATDLATSSGVLKPELFKETDDFISMYVTGDVSPSGCVLVSPKNYRGLNVSGYDRNTTFKFGGFPTITWTVDVWKSWLSSTGVENAVSKIREAFVGVGSESKVEPPQLYSAGDILKPGVSIKDALGMISENARRRQEYNRALNAQDPLSLSSIIAGKTDLLGGFVDFGLKIGGAFGVLRGVVKNMSQYYQQSLKPDTVMGAQNGAGRWARGEANFFLMEYGITKERAEIIDRFFTAYGYATNRFGKPYLFSDPSKSRPYINYVQTTGANINGSLPKDSADAIAAIFDAGVRFWTAQPSGGYPSPLANVNNYNALENLNAPPVG